MRRRSQTLVYKEVYDLGVDYHKYNSWFGLLTGGRGPDYTTFEQYALAAAAAYARVPRSREATLLLGDTKIRSDAELMLNFGLSGEDGVNPDEETCATIAIAMGKTPTGKVTLKDLEQYRNQLNKGQSAVVRDKGKNDVPLFGPGSLLSNPMWSPILNDAFILSGIHTNLLFVLALNHAEQGKWNAEKQQTVASIAKMFGGAVARPADADENTTAGKTRIAKDTWLGFIRQNPGMLWDSALNIPRVFMRELIGLKSFGYLPRFSEYQLSFFCTDVPVADDSTFVRYLKVLADVKFHENNKELLMKAVAEFLFGDQNALASISGAAKK